MFLTLTAPSFERTHHVPKWECDEGKRCGCDAVHRRDDMALRGLPLDLDGYDYAGQVRWHQALGRLWNATVARLRRVDADMELFRVFESQARGALHAHAIVRIPAFSSVTAAEMLDTVRAASTVREGVIVRATGEVLTEQYQWGQKGCDAREVKARHQDAAGVLPDESGSLRGLRPGCLASATHGVAERATGGTVG